jgi:hypothetical protein
LGGHRLKLPRHPFSDADSNSYANPHTNPATITFPYANDNCNAHTLRAVDGQRYSRSHHKRNYWKPPDATARLEQHNRSLAWRRFYSGK